MLATTTMKPHTDMSARYDEELGPVQHLSMPEPPPVVEELPSDSRPLIQRLGKEMRALLPLQDIRTFKRFSTCLNIVLKLEALVTDQLPGLGKVQRSDSVGTYEEVVAYCINVGLTENDGIWFFKKCDGNGWKNGNRPIRKWRSTVVAWQLAHYFPSQKPVNNGRFQPPKQRSLEENIALRLEANANALVRDINAKKSCK